MVIESIDNKTYSRETIKNHLIEIKKQLRGYLGFSEHYKGSYARFFSVEF